MVNADLRGFVSGVRFTPDRVSTGSDSDRVLSYLWRMMGHDPVAIAPGTDPAQASCESVFDGGSIE